MSHVEPSDRWRPDGNPPSKPFSTNKCRKCKAAIVFVRTAKGKQMPVNAETWTQGEVLYNPEKHVSHFATCPAAAHFRKADRGR